MTVRVNMTKPHLMKHRNAWVAVPPYVLDSPALKSYSAALLWCNDKNAVRGLLHYGKLLCLASMY